MVKSRLHIPKIYGHSAAQLTICWVRESPCLLGSMGHSAAPAQHTICWVRESRVYWGPWDTQQHNLRYSELENPRVYWGPWDTQQHNLRYSELENPRVSMGHSASQLTICWARTSTFYNSIHLISCMALLWFFVRHIHSLVGIIHSANRVALHCM